VLGLLVLEAGQASAQDEDVEDPFGYTCASTAADADCAFVAASVTGNASGQLLAVSGTRSADACVEDVGSTRVLFTRTCTAISGTEPARGDTVAVSGTENATADGVAVGPDGASGVAAASATGDADGLCAATSGTGDADARYSAVSGTGNASACRDQLMLGLSSCVAVSGTGDSDGWIAVSGTGNSSGWIAVSGTGTADGPFEGNAQWPFDGPLAASGTGHANGGCVALSGTGTAKGKCWLFGSRVEASGCETGRIAGASTACQRFGIGPAASATGAIAERESKAAIASVDRALEDQSAAGVPGQLPDPGDPTPPLDRDEVEVGPTDDPECEGGSCPLVAVSLLGEARTNGLAAVSAGDDARCASACPRVGQQDTRRKRRGRRGKRVR